MAAFAVNGDADTVWEAVEDAVQLLMQYDGQIDRRNVAKRLRDFTRRSATGSEANSTTWEDNLDQYAEKMYQKVHASFGGEDWFTQCDLFPCFLAGVKAFLPKPVQMADEDIEKLSLAAYDRVKVSYTVWENVHQSIHQSRAKKRIRETLEKAWQSLYVPDVVDGDDITNFVGHFILVSIGLLRDSSGGRPEAIMKEHDAAHLFRSILHAGALPSSLLRRYGKPPREWPYIDHCVRMAYDELYATGGVDAVFGAGACGLQVLRFYLAKDSYDVATAGYLAVAQGQWILVLYIQGAWIFGRLQGSDRYQGWLPRHVLQLN